MSDRSETGTGWPEGAQPVGETDAPSTVDSKLAVEGEPTPTPTPTPAGKKAEPTEAEPAEAEPAEAEPAGGPDATDRRADASSATDAGARTRLAKRVSAAGTMIGLLFGLLGFGLVVQLRSHSTDPQLASARPEDLVRILSDLDSRESRLRSEITSLEETQRQLASGAEGREAALAQARQRADELGVLAGTLPAQGPGLEIRFEARGEAIRSSTLLDAVEELRGAGAEAMQIVGADANPVRVVASTYFVDVDGGLEVDGRKLTAPYTILVIGEAQTMQTALNIPGGVVDTVRGRGGSVTVQAPTLVRVTALHAASSLKYARPAS